MGFALALNSSLGETYEYGVCMILEMSPSTLLGFELGGPFQGVAFLSSPRAHGSVKSQQAHNLAQLPSW